MNNEDEDQDKKLTLPYDVIEMICDYLDMFDDRMNLHVCCRQYYRHYKIYEGHKKRYEGEDYASCKAYKVGIDCKYHLIDASGSYRYKSGDLMCIYSGKRRRYYLDRWDKQCPHCRKYYPSCFRFFRLHAWTYAACYRCTDRCSICAMDFDKKEHKAHLCRWCEAVVGKSCSMYVDRDGAYCLDCEKNVKGKRVSNDMIKLR